MNMRARKKAILIDIPQCINCQSCVLACKQLQQFPEKTETELSATAFTAVRESRGRYVRRLCLHCADPACVSACPVGALYKTGLGPVVYDAGKCIGCRYCMLACPFKVPTYEWNDPVPYLKKCDMCAGRLARGGKPACVEACPTGAALFGDRESMLAEAHRRIRENPAYVPRVFGAQEAGGASVFFLSDVPFESLGFPGTLTEQPRPLLSAGALKDVPTVVTVGGTLLAALYWITQRRQLVALAEAEEQSRSAGSGPQPTKKERS